MDGVDDITQLPLLPCSIILLLRRLGLLTSPKHLSLEGGGWLINSRKYWDLEIEGVKWWGVQRVANCALWNCMKEGEISEHGVAEWLTLRSCWVWELRYFGKLWYGVRGEWGDL